MAQGLRKKARSFQGVEAWVAPSHLHLAIVADALNGSAIKVGAQTLSVHADAPHTGDASGSMLKHAGASFVIIGHSERRAQGETDDMVREQLMQALANKLSVVLCVGEEERVPDGSHFQHIANQINRALAGLQIPQGKLTVAYEPVWAIGKSAEDAMSPEELEETVIFIRKILSEALSREQANRVAILYGGSVEAANAAALIKEGGVGGLLVGHASAELDSFVEILKAAR